jgi:hypothetical protein
MILATTSGTIWTWSFVIGAAFVAWYFLNPKSLVGCIDFLSAQLTKATNKLRGIDPMAMKQAKINQAAEEVAAATLDLEKCRASMSKVQRYIDERIARSEVLEARANEYLLANKDDKLTPEQKKENEASALKQMLDKEKVDDEIKASKDLLAKHTTAYDECAARCNAGHERISELKRETKQQGFRMQMAKADASIANLGKVLSGDKLSPDSFAEIDEQIEDSIDANLAKGQVAKDLKPSSDKDKEMDNRARERKASAALESMKEKLASK